MAATAMAHRPTYHSSHLNRRLRKFTATALVTLFGVMVLTTFLMPLGYMFVTSLKSKEQVGDIQGPIWPARRVTFNYQGQDYPILKVPTEQGVKEWALVNPYREESEFVDPKNPEAGLIHWVGRWRTLEPLYEFSPYWENFSVGWEQISFPRLFLNTFIIAISGTIGTVLSSTAVAYGFSRFRIPGKNIYFLILMATIILPGQVTLIPTYAFFRMIGWGGTWWPLIIPHFFANAYNVFLLRQFFLSIPRELDEAAMIDGASPFRTLTSVIVPQSIPAVMTVALNHFFWSWNDFFVPLVYLSGNEAMYPISVGLQIFNNIYSREPGMLMAVAMMAMALPVTIFFLAQRYFMQGIVITGVEK